MDERVQLADAVQWPHRLALSFDLDGDRSAEELVLSSDVSLNAEGVPLWEDGHRWALFVDDAGQRTLLYGAFVPNGHVEAAVLSATSNGGRRDVLVRERTPQQLRTFVVAYHSPGAARGVSVSSYQVERWVPAAGN